MKVINVFLFFFIFSTLYSQCPSPHLLFSPGFNQAHIAYLKIKDSGFGIENHGTDSAKVQYYQKMINAKVRCADSVKNAYDWIFLNTYDRELDTRYFFSNDETTILKYKMYKFKINRYQFKYEANIFVSSQIKKIYFDSINGEWVVSLKKKLNTYTALEIYWIYEIITDMADRIDITGKEARLAYAKLVETRFFPMIDVSKEIIGKYFFE